MQEFAAFGLLTACVQVAKLDQPPESSPDTGTASPSTSSPSTSTTPQPEPTTPTTPVADDSVEQQCVDLINEYRATLSLPPYTRWNDAEPCVDGQAEADFEANTPHSAFGQCGEWAQNECPGWPGPAEGMIGPCFQMMWDEGPGYPFEDHGHYLNMSSPDYTQVSCGFYTTPTGQIWATQDFR